MDIELRYKKLEDKERTAAKKEVELSDKEAAIRRTEIVKKDAENKLKQLEITEKNLTNRKEQLDMKESELQKRQEAFEKKYHQALEELASSFLISSFSFLSASSIRLSILESVVSWKV